MLDEGSAPPLPSWTSSFIVAERENQALQTAIVDFEKFVTSAFWYASPDYVTSEPAMQVFQGELEQLAQQTRYERHQLVSMQVNSFDVQSANLAVVTVTETWQDRLFEGNAYDYDAETPPLGERGPYSLKVVYTLSFNSERNVWQVQQVVFENQPPGW